MASCLLPSDRVTVLTSEASIPLSCGVPSPAFTAGHLDRQSPWQFDLPAASLSKTYTVRPLPSTTILPRSPTVAVASFAAPAAGWLAGAELLGAEPYPEPLPPQAVSPPRPSTITPTTRTTGCTLVTVLSRVIWIPPRFTDVTRYTCGSADRFIGEGYRHHHESRDSGRGPARAHRDRRAGQRRLRGRLRHGRLRQRLGPGVPRSRPDPLVERQRADRQARYLHRHGGHHPRQPHHHPHPGRRRRLQRPVALHLRRPERPARVDDHHRLNSSSTAAR